MCMEYHRVTLVFFDVKTDMFQTTASSASHDCVALILRAGIRFAVRVKFNVFMLLLLLLLLLLHAC